LPQNDSREWGFEWTSVILAQIPTLIIGKPFAFPRGQGTTPSTAESPLPVRT